jgi:hypothetical protein
MRGSATPVTLRQDGYLSQRATDCQLADTFFSRLHYNPCSLRPQVGRIRLPDHTAHLHPLPVRRSASSTRPASVFSQVV